jgi:hypothetical protein
MVTVEWYRIIQNFHGIYIECIITGRYLKSDYTFDKDKDPMKFCDMVEAENYKKYLERKDKCNFYNEH